MRNSAADPKFYSKESPMTDEAISPFLSELSELCRKHRIGITGDATLFVMEPVDLLLSYSVDENSKLLFK
jgi:hypothetical protein